MDLEESIDVNLWFQVITTFVRNLFDCIKTGTADMSFEFRAQWFETVGYSRQQVVHSLEIGLSVVVEQDLEFFSEEGCVFLNEDTLTGLHQRIHYVRMQIHLHSTLLLAQS